MTSTNFHSNSKKNTETVKKGEDETSCILREDIVPDRNYNTLTTAVQKTSVTAFVSRKSLVTKEDRSEVEVVVNGSKMSLDSTCLTSVDPDLSLKKNAKMCDKKDDKSNDVLRRKMLPELNNNSLTNPFVASSDVLAPEKDRLGVQNSQNGTEISGRTKRESCSTSCDAQVSFEPKGESHQAVSVVSKCIPRTFGVKGKEAKYEKGYVLDSEENREVEFKSFANARPPTLPWKIMEKAKKFVCACLNADSKGIIYFGVGDSQEQSSKFKRGEIIGLDVEKVIDDIMKALQCVLDDHIKSDDGQLQKGGEQNCVNIEFVPVFYQGSRTGLYVVEIEVKRDWKFCKNNVYYSKSWAEKRGVHKDEDTSVKKNLGEFYKVNKDQYDDVAIRTNGASTSVKQLEVNRQVKEPLTAKYKEWKKEQKVGLDETSEDPISDDRDVQRLSALVRSRLRDLNFKDVFYVLIANKMPPQYRGTPQLAFLQNIPWLAVFDLFDAASKQDGLYYACNETTDAQRANLRSLDDFKGVSPDWTSCKGLNLSTRGTTWILGNEEMQRGHWIKCSRDCFYRAFSLFNSCCSLERLICVFLGLDESNVQEMVDMMECCFSILGNSASDCITIISEKKDVTDAFIKASKLQKELRECSITGIPWTLLKEIVREMIGPSNFEERGAKTELPYLTGTKEVFNKTIHSWDDLEVYIRNPPRQHSTEEIEKSRNAFYKGAQVSQINLFCKHDIERTLEEKVFAKIEQALNTSSKFSKDNSHHVIPVTVTYEPGSGATTLCRRILWNKCRQYRCAVVKAITPNTDFQIEQFQKIIYDENNSKFAPPCLVLLDNFPENDTRRLTERLIKRQTKCVILSTFPIAKSSTNSDSDLMLRQLDQGEMSLVKDILITITSDSKKRKEAEEVLEREKRFIWFGLELFGRDYEKIEERLQNHIKSILDFLDGSEKSHEMVLNFCCFLHYYSGGRTILPHPFVIDFLYETTTRNVENCALTQHIHKIFGGLLLEGFNDINGYFGWRPAHSLVSEAIISRINVKDTAVVLLEQSYKGKAYANKFLRDEVFKVFLERQRISDPVCLVDKDESIDSDFEKEVHGIYGVNTKYSPLILDILEGEDGIPGALRSLIEICLRTSEIDKMAYAWQQLARFMGYEMRANAMDAANEEHRRLYTAMVEEMGMELPMPKTGLEAAYIAVDIAIHLKPKYIHHYVTKGTLYLQQLRDFKPEEQFILPASIPDAITVCVEALDVYEQALGTTHELKFYPMIGKIQIILALLKIVKGLSFFRIDGERFTNYLQTHVIPKEMEDFLTQEQHDYITNLSAMTLGLLNQIFEDSKFKQLTTYGNKAIIRGLINAKIRASKLRRTFYEVTGFDKSQISVVDISGSFESLTEDNQALYQQFVQDVLFKQNETIHSKWLNLTDESVSLIYNALKALCARGHGSHDDMLICCKACLRLKERPSVEELDEIVGTWVKKYPNSEWANLFNYMIHFPAANKRLAPFNHNAIESMKKCTKLVLQRTGEGYRKSAAEYFLGKKTGLYAIVNRQQFQSLESKGRGKTDFWRSKEISERLERVCGQKDVNLTGVITYQGIQLRFDYTRYPKQSKDDLWFYVGFSLSGPYAYDPVDNDKYEAISNRSQGIENFDLVAPLAQNANGKGSLSAVIPRREKQSDTKNTNTKGQGASSERVSYASAVQQVHSRQLEQMPRTSSRAQSGPSNVSSAKGRSWEIIEGICDLGKKKMSFTAKHVDEAGKLHHGAWVLGAKKSKDCETHKSDVFDVSTTTRCPFAHFWRGDTLQHVCLICTRKNRKKCHERRAHEQFIYNLGPFYTKDGKIWRETKTKLKK